MKLFAAIQKRDEEQRMVWGYASTEAIDSQGEVVKLDAIKGAWDDYMKHANIREMHQPSAVGKCKEYEFDDKGVMIGVKVVDDVAWKKVQEEVYTGFSIGGKALNKVDGTITQLRLTEISLVDRPANPEALITVWKGEEIPGDEGGGTADSDPAAAEIGKSMWNAAKLLEALALVKAACEDAEFEQKRGEHSEGIIEAMKAAKQSLAQLLTVYVTEEVTEGANKADGAGDIEKAGARFSKGTKATLGEIHTMIKKCDEALTKMGYVDAEEAEDDASKADEIEDLRKLATERDAMLADIAKAIGAAEGALLVDEITKIAAEREDLKKRVAELEAMPEPPKGAVRVVDKADDAIQHKDPALAELEEKAEKGTLQPADLLKVIHARGGRPLMA